jgi:hypothetical protein
MSDPAAPWWAEVQHLRPREDAPQAPATPRTPSRRFAREAQPAEAEAALATLEHAVADPFAPSEPVPDRPRRRGTTDEWTVDDIDHVYADPRSAADFAPWLDDVTKDIAPAAETTTWDDSIEEAFAKAPSWSDEVWLMPKGADRIENGRRTIEIRGQVDRIHGFNAVPEPPSMAQRARRPGRRPSERFERRPDRVAMWAFLLGVLLIVIAALSQPGDADAAAAAVSQLALL